MGSAINIQQIRESIQAAMDAKDISGRALAKASGVDHKTIGAVLSTTDNPGIGTLYKIFDALELPFENVAGSARVPLVGEIGAGGLVAYFKEDEETELVPRPPLTPGPLIALRVRGESMLPKFEQGDVVYVRRDHDGILPQYMGRYCAVHLSDGGTYLKILSAGTQPDRYTLRSLNAADMTDTEVLWAAPVLFTMQKPIPRGDEW